ncbi:hypothetical protein DERF_006905 [Dermatophagoides farinae]|uniref:Uncharacterized protein n=1 Tax=Dermatophagoides farinae TaxID=6954 RepID=A0A922HWV1_DERFA|nr:hypothetical protein DERF_006905 [Dermatophagoides farinae]
MFNLNWTQSSIPNFIDCWLRLCANFSSCSFLQLPIMTNSGLSVDPFSRKMSINLDIDFNCS